MKKTITTVREFNADGKIVKETITETTDNDFSPIAPLQPYTPFTEPYKTPRRQWWDTITVRWNKVV